MRATLILTLASLLGLGGLTCSREKEKMVPIGPDARASLVIYFKTDATEDQINAFSQGVLSKPASNGRGYELNRAIELQLRVFPPVQGHEAIAVRFFTDATSEQREEVETAVSSSPIVYKVLKGVAPSEVKKIE